MIGRAGFFWVLFSLYTTAYAFNGPEPFNSFYEFLSALEEMPPDEFARIGDETPAVRMREYFQTLQELDPSNFERWNQKLKFLQAPGFSSGANYWELHPRGPELTIGFHPEKKPMGFESIADFYASVKEDEPGRFQTRVGLSSSDDLNRWLEIMRVGNYQLFETAIIKLRVVRVIGFHESPKYRLIEEPKQPYRQIGFAHYQDPFVGIPRINTVEDLINLYETSTPEEFFRGLNGLSKRKAGQFLGLVKKHDRDLYLAMLEKVNSRTKIGYTNASEPEIVAPSKNPVGTPNPVGFRQAPKSCADLLKPDR
ncbi:MAG: hypothetical protein KGP28_05655 [Bdellovibrionales bacterium]|nr:hypothetical protein [Bdellovibrionales bacterium]